MEQEWEAYSFNYPLVYPYIKEKVKTFLMFIDDLLMIWTGSEVELVKFINELKKKCRTIKFEF